MKILQLTPERILIIERAETRWIVAIICFIWGLFIAIVPHLLSTQNMTLQATLPAVSVGVLFIFLSIYILTTTKAVRCEIDKSVGQIRIDKFAFVGVKTDRFDISQVTSIELKESTGISYYIYKINFILNDYRRVTLTHHPSSERTEMQSLSNRVASFLNIRSQFSETREPLNFVHPGF